MRWLLLGTLMTAPAMAQELRVFSEFQRLGADGQVIAQDRVARRREILSPGVARNGFASWFLTAQLPAGVDYFLDVGQNPEDAVRVVLYRQHYNPNGVPDRLEKVNLPVQGKSMEAGHMTFWMDIWVDGNAPVGRIKLEPQLWTGDRWVIYPMEVRILETRIPAHETHFWVLPAPEGRSDLATINAWRDYLCRPIPAMLQPKETTIRLLQARNVQQDVALARNLGRDKALAAFVRGVLKPEQAISGNWCSAPVDSWRAGLGTEWYLRVRDFLYRGGVN
jgi:hypothetical protein